MRLTVPDPAAMHALGVRLAALLEAGDLLVLTGNLGAGKTVLTQGVGAGLGVRGPVTSPTFVIARVHADGRLPLVHVDAFRLDGMAEIDDLDLDTAAAESVTVVEWGAGLVEQLSDAWLEIDIQRPADGDVRAVTISAYGDRWATRAAALAALVGAVTATTSHAP